VLTGLSQELDEPFIKILARQPYCRWPTNLTLDRREDNLFQALNNLRDHSRSVGRLIINGKRLHAPVIHLIQPLITNRNGGTKAVNPLITLAQNSEVSVGKPIRPTL